MTWPMYFYNHSLKHLKQNVICSLKSVYTYIYVLYVAFYRGPYGRLVLYTNYVILLKQTYNNDNYYYLVEFYWLR